jgi:hypothetical protein
MTPAPIRSHGTYFGSMAWLPVDAGSAEQVGDGVVKLA